jgi:hypothetical protein
VWRRRPCRPAPWDPPVRPSAPCAPELDALTADQRAAVDRALAVPGDARTIEVPRPSASPAADRRIVVTTAAFAADDGRSYDDLEREVVEEGARVRAFVASHWGDIPQLNVRLANFEGMPFTTFHDATFGTEFEKCDVFVNVATADLDRFATRRALTFDVVHCFQTWKLGKDTLPGAVPGWAWEGPAQYVAASSWPLFDEDRAAWFRYIEQPDLSLFARTYDAIGFYAQLFWAGIDEWEAMRAVLIEADNETRFTASGANTGAFLDQWASTLARVQVDWGRAWTFDGPGIPGRDVRTPMQPMQVSNGSLEAISQDAYSNHLFALDSTADLVRVQLIGRPRLSDGTVDTTELLDAVFCTTDKGCQPCPDAGPLTPRPTRLADFAVLAISGGIDGTVGTIRGERFEDQCKRTPSPSPTATPTATPSPTDEPAPGSGPPCGTNCPGSTGEPHITTVDRVGYDFQAAGEYVLLRSHDGAVEIQARQVPIPGSAHVTRNTAVAARVNGRRVAIHTAEGADPPLRVLIDGSAVDASQPIDLGSEPASPRTTTRWRSASPTARSCGPSPSLPPAASTSCCRRRRHLRETARACSARRGRRRTVAGPPRRDAAPARHEPSRRVRGEVPRFGPAWLVTDETTLFDYAAGESRAGFVLPDFPKESEVRTIEDIPAEKRREAEAVCAEVRDEQRLEECVFDYSITNLVAFAQLYARTFQFEQQGPVAIGAPAPAPPPPPPDELPQGFVRVPTPSPVETVRNVALAADGRLFATVWRADGSAAVLAVDTAAGRVIAEVTLESATGSRSRPIRCGWVARPRR